MAVTIKRVMLWQTEIRDEPGALSATLEPLALAGLDLQAVTKRSALLGFRTPVERRKGVSLIRQVANDAEEGGEEATRREEDAPR